ncbi:MAG: CSLREA domain-containing protein [bacterium]|nr:CSLREA domain-containing protein [bacterium]
MPQRADDAPAKRRAKKPVIKQQPIAFLFLILLSFVPARSLAATFSVNTTDDLDDGSCDAIHCSFREAIIAANAIQDNDLIDFALLGSGDQTITPSATLPELSTPVTIDGATHPDGAIHLCGSEFSSSDVLVITHDATIYALRIECSVEGPLLTVSKVGSGSGTVTSAPAGIDCGADCAEAYDLGAVVTLTATADTSSTFAGWSGDADCTDGTVTLDADTSCTASFDPNQRTLTVNLAGSGSGTVTSAPAGIDCGADCAASYPHKAVIDLIATPTAGSTFAGWSGDSDCADGRMTLKKDTTCTATFDSEEQLTLTVSVEGSGHVASSPAGIDCGTDCSEAYAFGTVVALTATPAAGSAFGGWSGDADCADGTVTLDADITCTASFAGSSPIVTILSPNGGSTFAEDSQVAFAATAMDSAGGDITASIAWTSSKDGALGTGGAISAVLSKGNHVITASATDTAGGVGTASVSVRVRPNHLVLSNVSVDGQETHDAGLSITAAVLTVLSSGNLALSAGEVISLGDGFVVASDGSFSAGIDPTLVP